MGRKGLPASRLHRSAPRALVSGMPSDAHTWNLVYLQLLLEELGCDVSNLGACVPTELLLEHCGAWRPDLIVLGTLNGHGYNDGLECISALQGDPDAAGIHTVIGGKLGISGRDPELDAVLIRAGFTAVFGDDMDSGVALRMLVSHSLLPKLDRPAPYGVEAVR
jgi:methylmalonyl-CoA mutase cobalamin-binding subunit